jgi:hypothetical protein
MAECLAIRFENGDDSSSKHCQGSEGYSDGIRKYSEQTFLGFDMRASMIISDCMKDQIHSHVVLIPIEAESNNYGRESQITGAVVKIMEAF